MSSLVATKSTTKKSLTQQIRITISKKDIKKLYELKDICDHIFQSGESYKNYTIDDLPEDELYEEMVRTIENSASDLTETMVAEQTSNPEIKHRHQKLISDLWMGSITKETEILDIKQAMLLPKFDGCSCGVKLKRYVSGGNFELEKAVTRGTAEGYVIKQSDITQKFDMIASVLLNALSSNEASNYKFNDVNNKDKTFNNVLQITLRGEIVLKDRKTTNSAPASVVAGKINGHMAVWQEAIPTIEFIPYEIIRCNYSLTDYYNYYVPTQAETIDLFNKLSLIHFPVEIVDLNKEQLPTVESHFKMLNETIPQPMDGVVYCSCSWRYPTLTEQTKPKQYGKYAWKPSSEATSTLKSISYSLARDGKFTFMLSYDPVKIGGKLYRNAKTATSRMLQLEGIGIGSIITVKLAGDISPMIVDFLNEEQDNIKPIELPKTCPFCKTKTILKKTKTASTLTCPNPACPEVVKQKMINFLSTLGIKGIAEGKLNKLPLITLANVVDEYLGIPFIKNKISKTDTRTFLVALGIGGAQAVSKKLKEKTRMNPLNDVKYNFDELCLFLDPYMNDDPFVNEIIEYLGDILFNE